MSAGSLTTESDRSKAAHTYIEPEQHTGAKAVGFLYLFTMATSIVGFSLRGRLIVPQDAAQTAANIAASARLFRVSIVSDLLTVAGVIILVLALYVVLKPVNRHGALLATYWRIAENVILAVITLNGFAIAALLGGGDASRAFDAKQLSALVSTLYRVWGAGFNVGFVFLGLGSTTFSYLWLKSHYIPRALAAWGIFSSLVLAVVSSAVMAFPGLATLGLTYMLPLGVYEVGLGLWLLVKGIKAPRPAAGT